jgi:O-antigen ligase
LLRRIVSNHWFALADLFLVILSGLLWIFRQEIGILPIIAIALIPWAVRLLAGLVPFRRTPIDWLVALFLVTAWVGYWAAYDREAAAGKAWLIVLAVLLFYALAAQPQENLEWVCALFYCIGLGVSIYFFLTQDFVALPRKVEFVNRMGRWITDVTPRLGWNPIHPNYVAGVAAITTPFILYPAERLAKRRTLFSTFLLVFIIAGLGVTLTAVLMATSRGVIMAIASAFGLWIMWRIIDLNGSRLRLSREAVFPSLVLICLCAVVLFLYAGPAKSGSAFSDQYFYGTGSRGELFERSLYLLSDFPFTGGGLGAFPGLYSYYMLGIPNFNVPNSHNLFLDVGIEQGWIGGLSFLIIFLTSIWFIAREIVKSNSSKARIFYWLTFFALVIAFVHGLVDDYLYNGNGTILALALPGIAMATQKEVSQKSHRINYYLLSSVALVLAGFFIVNLNRIRSAWYADLGAVQVAKVELADFPTNQWTDPSILPHLDQADVSLHTALQIDPANRTANHRLGLISMLQGDFHSASTYLEKANQVAPNHRGITKSLGYCYAWSGNIDKAQLFLDKIPEAKTELDTYVWWWGVQGRPDLAQKASIISSKLETLSPQD